MKALSIKQPWASLIATGLKTIETRTWPTNYRGELLIVSSKTQYPKNLPLGNCGCLLLGHALCVAKIVDCRPMTKSDEKAAMCDVYENAFAWVLEDIRKLEPFPVKGQLGLYEVKYESDGK